MRAMSPSVAPTLGDREGLGEGLDLRRKVNC